MMMFAMCDDDDDEEYLIPHAPSYNPQASMVTMQTHVSASPQARQEVPLQAGLDCLH